MPQYNRLILNDVYVGPFSHKTPFLHNALLISLVVHSTFIMTVKSNLDFILTAMYVYGKEPL
jgi:hypothetical protein